MHRKGYSLLYLLQIKVWFLCSSVIIEYIMKGNNEMEEYNKKEFEAVIDGVEDIEDEPRKPKKGKKQGIVYELLDLLKTFVICAICVFLLTTFVVKPVRVDGQSMYPTLENEEIGVMNVFSAKFLSVERQDVVVVYNEQTEENWVKRVIGMPGDTIYAKDDILYVNGIALEEPYLDTAYAKSIRNRGDKFTGDFEKVTLKEDEYFMMGDNRVVSHDSRRVGPFKGEDIRGKDVYVVYPFNKMKMVRNGAK